jgi:leucine dehydrogenase
MSIFDFADFDAHEGVHAFTDKATGLKAIVALHSTVRGPACGGTRMWPYADSAAAMTDALRLSRGMSYKNAMANLPLGGGKAVILGDARSHKSDALMRALGRAVDSLGGRYITAMDVGMTEHDMGVIASVTKHVAGYAQAGKSGGDPSPMTAWGVFCGIKAAWKHLTGTDDLTGVRVAVQGAGNVGFETAHHLRAAGAVLTVSDINEANLARAVSELGAAAVPPMDIHKADVDVLSPCALGATLNDKTIPEIKAKAIAGGANNQLAKPNHGLRLVDRGILYAPDYVINGGGIIRVCGQIYGWSDAEIEARTTAIGETLAEIFSAAKAEGKPTHEIADRIARARLAAVAA